jgi:hypothetical protein
MYTITLNKGSTPMKESFFTLSFLILMNCAFPQGKNWEVVSGFGFPDVLHIGVNMSVSQKHFLGITFGTFGYVPSELKSVQFTFEHKTNFAYSKKFTGRPTWYFGERLTYSYEDNNTYFWRTLYLTPGIGRHLNITDKFGLNADLGIFIRLWEKHNGCSRGCDDEERDLLYFISPTARFQIFYRL